MNIQYQVEWHIIAVTDNIQTRIQIPLIMNLKKQTDLLLIVCTWSLFLLQACNNSAAPKGKHQEEQKAETNEQAETITTEKTCVPDAKLSEGAALLFACVETSMTPEERNQVFEVSGLRLTADKKHLTEVDEEDAFPSEQEIHIIDLNKDGIDEIVLLHGHHSLYNGRAGRMLQVFIKQANGKYQQVMDTFGIDLVIMSASHNGFPDLVPGEGGFEFGVFHYDGKTYKRKGRIKDKDLAGERMSEISKSHIAPMEIEEGI